MRKLLIWTVLASMVPSCIFAQETDRTGVDVLKEIEASGDFMPMFPFQPTHNVPDNITNVRTWARVDRRAAGVDGFIQPAGDHFVDGAGGEIRFIGTNIGMTGCFPDHAAADKVAEELTRYGINIVRMHYVSHRTPGNGYPVLNSFIEPVQLERFDYFIAKLKENGIYTYFQLNIARKFSRENGFENAHLLPYYKNGVDNIDDRMIELQKRFHDEILNHVNPYTGIAYKDEPSISMMELANENSIINSWFAAKYDFPNLVEPYKTRIIRKWNAWLVNKYGTTENLKKAWLEDAAADGAATLHDTLLSSAGRPGWDIQNGGGAESMYQYRRSPKRSPLTDEWYLRLLVQQTTDDKSAPKLFRSGVRTEAGVQYTLRFKIRSDIPMNIMVRLSQSHAPWKTAGLSATVRTTGEWKEYRFDFAGTLDDRNTRLMLFSFVPGVVDIADVSLVAGSDPSWPAGQSLEKRNIDWPCKYNWKTPWRQRSLDFTEFLADAENAYFTDLYDNVKNYIKVHQPVTGTQLGYGFNYPQAAMDYCDIHGYWCHPAFPGGTWNNKHWNLRNGAVVNSFGHPGSTFTKIARSRILGKPFTLSEYDHPNLNFYCAEADIMMAALGAFQNWSALMQFAWILDTDFDREHIWPMFDMCSAPQKLVHFPACYAMFVRGDVRKGDERIVYAAPSDRKRDIAAVASHEQADGYAINESGLVNSLPLAVVSGMEVAEYPELYNTEGRTVIRTAEDVPSSIREAYRNKMMHSTTGELTWNWQQKDAGYFTVDTRNTKVFTGFVRGRSFVFRGMRLTPGRTRLDWLTLSLTLANPSGSAKPGNVLRAGSYLLAATGLVHNTDAKIVTIAQPGKISCSEPDGGRLGTSPVLCEGIEAEIAFAGLAGRVECWALDPDGNRMQRVPVASNETGEAVLNIGPQYRTVWYEVTVLDKNR